MDGYTFPSSTTSPGLLDELRRLGDLYGPAGVAAAAVEARDEQRVALGGRTGIFEPPAQSGYIEFAAEHGALPRPPASAVSRQRTVALIAAASTFADQLLMAFDATDSIGVVRDLADACAEFLA